MCFIHEKGYSFNEKKQAYADYKFSNSKCMEMIRSL